MDFGNIGAGAAGGAVVAIVIKASDEFSSTFEKATRDMGGLQKFSVGVTGAMVTLGGVVVGVTDALYGMAIEAAKAGDIQETFNKLAGDDAAKALEKMNAASLETISNVNLMKMANDALIKGMKTEDLPTLTKYSQQLADMGKGDVAGNMETITQAFATGRTAQLKGLGVIVDENAAYKKYAESIGIVNDAKGEELKKEEASIQAKIDYAEKMGSSNRLLKQLTAQLKAVQDQEKQNVTSSSDFSTVLDDSQKKLALHAEILNGVAEASKKLPEPMKDAADNAEHMTKVWDDMKISIGTSIGSTVEKIQTNMAPTFMQMADIFTTKIMPAIEVLMNGLESMSQAFDGNNEAVTAFVSGLGYVVQGLLVFFGLVFKGIATILGFIDVIWQWGKILKDVIVDKVVNSFKLMGDYWTLIKDMFKLGALEIELVFKKMANNIIDSFQNIINTVTNWINNLVDVYNKMASKLGFSSMSHVGGFDLSGFKFDTASIEAQMKTVGTDIAKTTNNINVEIQSLTGVNPDDMAKALRKQLNDLVST